MSQRRPDPTKWVWCVLVLSSWPAWGPVSSVTVRKPEKIPSTIETQAKFFQDFFSVQLSPYKIEFGHVCEDPNTWEQRYEKKDFKNHRDMGKVRWGDKKGGYGEHYWDLNHAGHAGNQEEEDEYYDDDDDYNEELQYYPDTEEKANIEREEYYPDASEYERSARPKRENSKVEVHSLRGERNYEEKQRPKNPKLKRANTEPTQIEIHNIDTDSQDNFDVDLMKMSSKDNRQKYAREYDEKIYQPSEKNHIVLVVEHKVKNNYKSPGDRRLNRQVTPASVPRLVLESSTGHVIDRATGQAYVLQPVHHDRKYD